MDTLNPTGNREDFAFRALFMAHYPRVVYFSYRLVGVRHEAEDIAQEAFARYWIRRGEVSRDETSIKSYLYETARNLCLNFRRHQAVERGFLATGKSPDEQQDAANAMISAESLDAIHKAVASLPTRCREIAAMAYLEGVDNREIARRFGLSIHTVRAQKHRAILLLRERLDREHLLLLFIAREA